MKNSKIIIISGPSSSGKSTLANKIANEFLLPLLSKDMIKESLMEDMGVKTREDSIRIGKMTYNILYLLFKELVSKKVSFITESTFYPEHSDKVFQDLANLGVNILQINLDGDRKIFLNRFTDRAKEQTRHKGHAELENLEEFSEMILSRDYQLKDFPHKLIKIDTSDFNKLDYEKLLVQVKEFLSNI